MYVRRNALQFFAGNPGCILAHSNFHSASEQHYDFHILLERDAPISNLDSDD